MEIGVIIKCYRKQRGWTQKDLGNGICSEAHLGKIEKGTTKFSPATIDLLCERLKIQAEEEMERFNHLNNQLYDLNKRIVKLQLDGVKNELNKLADNPFIYIDSFRPFFILIKCRYDMKIGNVDEFNKMMKELNENYPTLQKPEWYMKQHILGIKEYKNQQFHKVLEHLMKIKASEYPNHEFYYHIAGALLHTDSQVKAFFYINKALDYFKQTNNFKRIIDTEILQLILVQKNEIYHFNDILQKYRDLIQLCDSYQAPERKWVLLNNLAFTYFTKKKFEKAQTTYEEAKKVSDDITNYIPSLIGEIESRLWQSKPLNTEKKKWLDLIEEGVSLSKNNEHHKIHFHLLTLLAKGEKRSYYGALHKELIPYLKESGDYLTARFYAKEAYQYFLTIEKEDIASQLAVFLME